MRVVFSAMMLVLSFSFPAAAVSEVMFTTRSAQYSFSEWRGNTSVPYVRLLSQWSLPTLNINTNGIVQYGCRNNVFVNVFSQTNSISAEAVAR